MIYLAAAALALAPAPVQERLFDESIKEIFLCSLYPSTSSDRIAWDTNVAPQKLTLGFPGKVYEQQDVKAIQIKDPNGVLADGSIESWKFQSERGDFSARVRTKAGDHLLIFIYRTENRKWPYGILSGPVPKQPTGERNLPSKAGFCFYATNDAVSGGKAASEIDQ